MVVRYKNVPDCLVAAGARERHEPPRVYVGVAECDEPLVLAAIVPLQEPVRQEGFQRVEQALEPTNRGRRRGQCVACLNVVIEDLILTLDGRREERGGR